jgi:hypothetical protein
MVAALVMVRGLNEVEHFIITDAAAKKLFVPVSFLGYSNVCG